MAYTSSTNSFYKINDYVADLIENTNMAVCDTDSCENSEEIKSLHNLKLLTTEAEDNDVVDLLRMKFLMHSYSKEDIAVTICPTLSCNLRCPYCFEKNKKQGFMDEKTCDAVIDFINSHTYAKTLSLNWYGGEPLLCTNTIRYFLTKLSDIKDIKLVSHGMVTNATLLKDENLELFKEYPLNSIQVTFDGIKSTHDTKRIYADGRGSYDEIVKNLKNFVEYYPETFVSIRVNIDKNNANQFMTIYETIKGLFPDKKNIIVYPGIIKDCGIRKSNSPILMNEDIVRINEQFTKRGYPLKFPHTVESGCCANCLSSYIIGPQGEIYKCWEDVGCDTCVIGNIYDKKYTNMPLLAKYMLYGSHILENECKECPLIPICSNDCAHNRINNKFANTEYELCSIYKNNDFSALNTLLYNFYCKFVTNKANQQ